MNAYPALLTAGIIFIIVGIAHLLRLFFMVEVTVAGKRIPFWVSFIGFIIPAIMAIWIFTVIASH